MGRVKREAVAPVVERVETAETVDVRQHTLETRVPLAERMNDENRIPVEEEQAARQRDINQAMGVGLLPTPIGFSAQNPFLSSVTVLK